MTYYQKELIRIRSICHSNQGQIDTVISTRKYIDNNYSTDINLDMLSHIKFTSKYHLLRLFKRYYGQTPKQYLIDKRILESKKCLRKGLSVRATCFAVGFSSPGSFSSLFKEKVGMPPSTYRKEQFSRS